MSVSENMHAMVLQAKREAQKAEDLFDQREREIQRMASRNIDLFGGSAVSQVAEIAAACKEASHDLYATKQMLVALLDSQCRPLLDQNPSSNAVLEVAEYMKTLNDESAINNNFTGTFNGNALGDLAAVRYSATIENRMIQKFWETTYSSRPDVIAAREERVKQLAAAREQEKKKREEEKQQYEKAYADWSAKSSVIKAKQDELLSQRLPKAREQIIADAHKHHDDEVMVIQQTLSDERNKKAKAEQTLASLGLFQLSQKKAQKQLIESIETNILGLQKRLEGIDSELQTTISQIDNILKQREGDLRKQIEVEIPCPPEPDRPAFMPRASSPIRSDDVNKKYKEAILVQLSDGKGYTTSEIMSLVTEVKSLSDQRLSAIMRQMVADGQVKREEVMRKAYFSKI